MDDENLALPDMSDISGATADDHADHHASGLTGSARSSARRTTGWTDTQVLDLSGALWLIGIDWESREAPQSKSQIRARAREIGADMAVQRVVDGAVQVGYGFPVEGLRPSSRVRSLAASVAQGVKQPWLGIYQISEDLYWYVAVRDGFQIMPGSDIVADRRTVEALRREHRGLSGDWTQKDGTLEDLESLIDQFATRSPKVWFLNQSQRPFYLTLAACGILAAGGYYAYHRHEEAVHAAKMAALARMRRAEQARLASRKEPLPPSPVVGKPMPDKVVSACMGVVGQVPLSIDGWRLASLSCTNRTVSVGWKRSKGATLAASPRGAISPDGNTISNTIALPIVQKSKDNAARLEVGVADFRIYLQSAGVERSTVIIRRPKPVKRTVYQRTVDHKPPPPPPPPEAVVSFVWPVLPSGTDWNRIPGFRITSITHEKDGWKIGGTIYGKRPRNSGQTS